MNVRICCNVYTLTTNFYAKLMCGAFLSRVPMSGVLLRNYEICLLSTYPKFTCVLIAVTAHHSDSAKSQQRIIEESIGQLL
jgi:hypothetical protein